MVESRKSNQTWQIGNSALNGAPYQPTKGTKLRGSLEGV
jgi:hypothetical protein